MTDMATHAWWPFMHRDIATETAKCNPCVKIGKSLIGQNLLYLLLNGHR